MNFYRVSVQDDEHGMPALEEDCDNLPAALRLVADILADSAKVYRIAADAIGQFTVVLTPNGLNIGGRTYVTVKEVE